MAKGIIKTPPMGGSGGALVVTDTTPGVDDPSVNAGDVILVSDGSSFSTGTPVSFTAVKGAGTPALGTGGVDSGAPTATGVAVDGTVKCTLITSANNSAINVGPGQAVLVIGNFTIGDKITANGGTAIVLDGVNIDGKIEGSNNAIVIVNNIKVDGKIETVGCKYASISNSNVDGKISSTSDNFVRVCTNTVKGKLEVLTPTGTTKIGNNTVDGKVTLPPVYGSCS